MAQTRALVTGAGGFIGHHLVTFLRKKGYWVRGVDIKYPEYRGSDANEFEILDLRRWDNCLQATRGIEEVYGLAADMGGMGFISSIIPKSCITTRLSTPIPWKRHASTGSSVISIHLQLVFTLNLSRLTPMLSH